MFSENSLLTIVLLTHANGSGGSSESRLRLAVIVNHRARGRWMREG